MIKFIDNIGDFFSSNYFDEDFVKKVHSKSGYSFDDQKELQKRITPLKDKYYRYKQNIIEGRLRIKDKIYETHQFHSLLLNALGYDGDHHQYNEPFHFKEKEVLPVRHKLYRGDKLHLLIMEMQPLIKEGDEEPDGLFEQRYNIEEEELESKEQRYHRVQWSRVFKISEELKISPVIINKAISELSLLDQKDRPQYILLLAGNKVFLIEVEKWFRGSYLQLDLEELFTEATIERKYYSLFYLMLSKEMLAPDSEMVLMDQLEEDSHKSAYEVTKDLKEGIIHAVEALANEALHYKKGILKEEFDESDDTFEAEIKDDCLSIVYRLLFVFYAESRADLDILPISDSVYQKGYSLEMLRDLEQTKLVTDHSLNGYFFHDSLKQLFQLMSSGYRENENGSNKSFRIRHIDSPMFDDTKLHHLSNVKFRNYVWQDVICQLSLSRQQNKKARGRISYANLGINQLGSVYESLLAYRGFYAEEDYIEVHPKKKPKEGTLLVQRKRRDDFHEDEVLKDESGKEVVIPKGQFVYRLSGRDRQKSASYYTPEVLTQCTVKYTLKGILEKVENGEMKALELLDLKLLEPAMGAAAFHNELINQLAEAYLSYRQKEKKEKISPEKYREELQKVKAYIATNNAYGVDLNPTAIELGKLSLWLNVIHKDMETPFFANRLAVGNAVVGAWFKVYTEAQLKKKWWEKAPKLLQLGPNGEKRKKNEIYHFLLPDKGMVPSAGIKLLKDEFPTHASRVTDWRKAAIKPISAGEFLQLQKICESIDEQLEEYYTFQKRLNAQTKNKVDIWGGFKDEEQIGLNLRSYDEKEQLNDQRNRQSAPYYKLKMVMDYWCSLWFWDVRKAEHLPSRQQYINDIASILNIDLTKQTKAEKVTSSYSQETTPSLFEEPSVGEQAQQQIIEKTQKGDLFDNKERLEEVKNLSAQHRFFHNQLEFIEVFKERGGFDVIVGNPPWISINFQLDTLLSEFKPEVFVKGYASSDVRKLNDEFLLINKLYKSLFFEEVVFNDSLQIFSKSKVNYPNNNSSKSNLHKLITENSLHIGKSIGLVVDKGVFDDPNSGELRKSLYPRMGYLFRFRNELKLFSEVGNAKKFEIIILNKPDNNGSVHFNMISNLFHPKSIDSFYVNKDHFNYGLKNDKNEWELSGNLKRIINISDSSLQSIAKIIEGSDKDYKSSRLLNLHNNEGLKTIIKLTSYERQLSSINSEIFGTQMLNETTAVKNKTIKRKVDYSGTDNLVISGPHFYVSTPYFKNPNEGCNTHRDYSLINIESVVRDEFIPRSNYILIDKEFKSHSNYYHIHRRRGINSNERTLIPTIQPPNRVHIYGGYSMLFKHQTDMLMFNACSQSIVYDYAIRATGKEDLLLNSIDFLPILKPNTKYTGTILNRSLRLNCVNYEYENLWNSVGEIMVTNTHYAFKLRNSENSSSKVWSTRTPLISWFDRRVGQIELDVLTAMAFELTLEELISLYDTDFSVLKTNDNNTFYDSKGNIIFTTSKGLSGLGVDRPVWNTIKNLKAGETYEHTIEKSELYHGKKVTYYAPFDKCDRVEDYKTAWAHFEEIFKEN